jgi:hypothetical protein
MLFAMTKGLRESAVRFGRACLAAPADGIAVAALAVVSVFAVLTYSDYGMTRDEYAHRTYGDLLFAYYASGFTDLRAFSLYNMYYYGGGFDLVASTVSHLFSFDGFETRRFLGAVVGIAGLFLVWRMARRFGGPAAGAIALVLLAATPLYYGHMFINPKDVPFAVTMALLLYAFMRAFEEYPRPQPSTIVLFAVALGLTIGTRVVGGMAFLFVLASTAIFFFHDWKAAGARQASLNVGTLAGRLALGLPLAYLVMAIVWPWGAFAPLNPVRAIQYYSKFWEMVWKELYDGAITSIVEMPGTYVPKLLLLKLPEAFSLLAIAGLAGGMVAALRGDIDVRRRATYAMFISAGTMPIALATVMCAAFYNGVRLYVFVLPPLAIMAGLAGAYALGWISTRSRLATAAGIAAVCISVGFAINDLVRVHPYQYTLYNQVAGGLRGASKLYMTDYWGLGMQEASEELLEQIENSGLYPPSGRRWRIAVCGPSQTVAAEMGKSFEVANDARGADFAVSMGTFYCARLDAPVIARVERDGVVFARAYDVRGRSYATTYAFPPKEALTQSSVAQRKQ